MRRGNYRRDSQGNTRGRTGRTTSRQAAQGRKNPRKKKKGGFSNTLVVCLLLIIVCTLAASVLFKVDSVVVSGNSRYQQDTILKVSGIPSGINLFMLDGKEVQEKLEKELPYLEGVTISRSIPNKIVINIAEAVPVAVYIRGNDHFIIDKKGKIVDVKMGNEDTDLPVIVGVKAVNPLAGEQLTFEDAGIGAVLVEILEVIDQNQIEEITEIDLTSLAYIKLNYQNRIKINLGFSSDLDYKLRYAMDIINEMIDPNDCGTLNVSLALERNKAYFDKEYLNSEE